MDDSFFVTGDNLEQYTQEARETYQNGAYKDRHEKKKRTGKDTIKLGVIYMVLPIVIYAVARLIAVLVDIAAVHHFDEYGYAGHAMPAGTLILAYGLVFVAPVLFIVFICGIVLLIIGIKKSKKEKNNI